MTPTVHETASIPSPRRAPPGRPAPRSPRPARAANPRYQHVLSVTLDALRASLTKDMPAGALRSYWQWGLDPANPFHEAFLQAMGARQLCRLTVTLLDGLVAEPDWPVMARHIATMNVYQIYEIVSDNLGIGAVHGIDPEQRAVLHGFTQAMVAALGGSPLRGTDLLEPVREATGRLSGFAYSLNGDVHARMAAAFIASRSRPSHHDIEYGLWPALVANLVSGVDVAESLAGQRIGDDLRQGLVNRYTAVNRTLAGHHLPLPELATVGSHAILVTPTLGYYAGVLGEIMYPDPTFAAAVANGTLPEALHDAAMLVRLLNDIGPMLLRGTALERWQLVEALEREYTQHPDRYPDLDALLLSDTVPSTVLTRLRKDLEHREFNIALYGFRRAGTLTQALAAFDEALDYFATLYRLHAARLRGAITALGSRLDDRRPIELISRFVRFHEELYANPYTEASGEYAV